MDQGNRRWWEKKRGTSKKQYFSAHSALDLQGLVFTCASEHVASQLSASAALAAKNCYKKWE